MRLVDNGTPDMPVPPDARITTPDMGRPDATPDMQPIDMQPIDLGVVDMQPIDRGAMDMQPVDIGAMDMLPVDVGVVDMRPLDAHVPDAMPVDAMPPPERCNDVDDDGDGRIDEDFDVGEPCARGVGACRSEGVRVCDGEEATTCEVRVFVMPEAEVCTAGDAEPIDEDCDGQVDEAIGRLGVGGNAEVGNQNAVPEDEQTLDVALSNTHTVVLARLNGGLRAVIFRRGAEGDGSIATVSPFAGGLQAQIVRAGNGFAFAAINAEDPTTVHMALMTWGANGERQLIAGSTGFVNPISHLILAPSPEGQVTLFVHEQGQAEVIRRDVTNALEGNRTWRLATPGHVEGSSFAAAARGNLSHVLWRSQVGEGQPSMAYRSFDQQGVLDVAQMPIELGEPVLMLREADVFLGSLGAEFLRYRVLNTQFSLRFQGTRHLPDIAYPGDDHALMVASGANSGSIRLYDPPLQLHQSLVIGDTAGRLHVATADREAAVVWRDGVGVIRVRGLRFGCR